jgi:hypothetical protein
VAVVVVCKQLKIKDQGENISKKPKKKMWNFNSCPPNFVAAKVQKYST